MGVHEHNEFVGAALATAVSHYSRSGTLANLFRVDVLRAAILPLALLSMNTDSAVSVITVAFSARSPAAAAAQIWATASSRGISQLNFLPKLERSHREVAMYREAVAISVAASAYAPSLGKREDISSLWLMSEGAEPASSGAETKRGKPRIRVYREEFVLTLPVRKGGMRDCDLCPSVSRRKQHKAANPVPLTALRGARGTSRSLRHGVERDS